MSVTVPDTPIPSISEALPIGPVPAAGPEPAVPVVPVSGSGGDASKRVRVPLRLHPDTKERAKYWASQANISVNEYATEALEEKIRRENGDYDLPTLEIARLGQLTDQIKAQAIEIANLTHVVTTGFASLMGLTRGDNYLLDEDDGELGENRE